MCVCVLKFADAECAKKALEQLNGFELAGRPMKVGHVTERTDASTASSFLDNDELERTGIDLGTTGRLQLMARLAEGEFTAQWDTPVRMEPLMGPGSGSKNNYRFVDVAESVLGYFWIIILEALSSLLTRPKQKWCWQF